MKKIKKSLSLLLSLVMTITVLFGLFAGSKIEANAATTARVTQNDAVAWLKNRMVQSMTLTVSMEHNVLNL